MEEKKYLKGWQKVAYGAGDFGSNFMYTFVSSFVLIYLTDTVGLNAGIIGTLMLLSKCLDGVTDVFFGRLIDRTKNRMGKARPWMFWSTFPLAMFEILLFIIPDMGQIAQYGYFFVVYTLLNAFFYTANNIAYATLTAFITKNPNERVQAGTYRFMFAMLAGIVISSITAGLVDGFGGGAAGWRMVAIIYTLVMIGFNMLTVFSVKEVTEESGEKVENTAGVSFLQSIKLLLSNKYYLLILAFYLLQYGMQGITNGVGIYFCTYVLNNPDALGLFSFAGMIPMIVGLAFTPGLVRKFGIYKVNKYGMAFSVVFGIAFAVVGYSGNMMLMLGVSMLRGLGMSPMLGTLNAVIAETSEYTYRKDKVHLDGTMFSCSSMGIKLGGGIGTAACGWLLALGGYVGGAAAQSAGAVSMITFMYAVIPAIICVLMFLVVSGLNVEKGIKALEK
ncbi:MAG: MFS transporter [Oscillospiraceae bacterium]|nr:MFS transporter [Oscillospiraceae bacterium]MBR3973378.1 MFS transporter [Oscillospiraceae bacterium]